MRPLRALALPLIALLFLTSCSRDPNAAKKRYIEKGNRYFEKGKFRDARIMYLDAKQKDPRFGPAWYKLGLTAIKLGNLTEAVQAFRRSLELLSPEDPGHWDSMIKLSEIYLAIARDQKQYLDDVEGYCGALLKRDANSFDGRRLSGDLDFARAAEATRTARKADSDALLDAAIKEYRKADQISPNQKGVLLQLARSLAGRQQYGEAERVYQQAIALDKSDGSGHTELYKLLIFEGKRGEAEQLLKTAIHDNPKQVTYMTMLALHYALEKRRDDMAAVLEKIKGQAKEFDEAYLIVGDFYLRLGDGETAIREYKEGLAKEPKKRGTYQKRIVEVLARQGKRAEAAELTAQILKDNPKDTEARELSAGFLLDQGDVNRAFVELQALVSRDPDNAVARYNLGRAHLARGEGEQARQMWERAIELRPDYIVARVALAQLAMSKGQYDAALKGAAEILKYDKANADARLIASAALMGQKKYADSRMLLEDMLKMNPSSADAYFQLGVNRLAEKKYKEAEEAFRRCHELNPANSRGMLGIVEVLVTQNRPDEAIRMLQAELARNPQRKDFRLALGDTEFRTGKYEMAIAEYETAMKSAENARERAELYLRLGETYRRKGDLGGAITMLQKGREAQKDNVAIMATLGLVLDAAGRWSEAKQAYEATLKADGSNAVVLNNLAFILAEHGGDLNEAITKAQQAKRLLPSMPEVSDTLGLIYLKQTLVDSACDIFKELVARYPAQSVYRMHLGMALSQKGDKPRAIRELQEALRYNPTRGDRTQIQQMLSKLGA